MRSVDLVKTTVNSDHLPSKTGIHPLLLAVIAATAGACRSDEPNTSIIYGMEDSCPVDENTDVMQFSWADAKASWEACFVEAEADANQCENEGGSFSECSDNEDESRELCMFWYMKKVNKIPLRVCGEAIYNITGENIYDANYDYSVNENDYDGDGISAWEEYWMGLNPCSQYSSYNGECIPDGELDYDGDRIINSEDERPLCYGENGQGDPGDYYSDCV